MKFNREFEIVGNDFANAGQVSTEIKAILKNVGYPNDAIRRLTIASFEAEMNVVMYARRGLLKLELEPERIRVILADEGPGIPDIDLAMQEGYSTATDAMRERGFGAGMGLPNIRRNTDALEITSQVAAGTRLDFMVVASATPGRSS